MVNHVDELIERKRDLLQDAKAQKAEILRLENEAMEAGDAFVQANLGWILKHAPGAADYIRSKFPDPKLAESKVLVEKKDEKIRLMQERLLEINESFLAEELKQQKEMEEKAEEEKAERKKRNHNEMEDLEGLGVVNGKVDKARKIARGRRAASASF